MRKQIASLTSTEIVSLNDDSIIITVKLNFRRNEGTE